MNSLGQPTKRTGSNFHATDGDALRYLLALVADDAGNDGRVPVEVGFGVECDCEAVARLDVERWCGRGDAE